MNPYAFLAKLAGIGLVAGTAVAMVKLVEKVWPKTDGSDSTFEYIAVAGEFPPEDEDGSAAEADGADSAADGDAGTGAEDEIAARTAQTDTENDAADRIAETDTANDPGIPAQTPGAPAAAPAAAAPDAPNENPVDAPPAVPVTDPLKIADPADFQDWDGLGCQG